MVLRIMLAPYPLFKSALKTHRKGLMICAAVLFVQAIIMLILPLPVRYALDHIVQNPGAPDSAKVLFFATAALLVLGFLASALEYTEERLNVRLINSIVTSHRKILLEKSLAQKQSFLDGKRKVDVSSRLSGDVQNLEALFITGLVIIVRSVPSLLFVIGAMLYINLKFAAVVLAMLPLFYLLIVFLSKRIKAWEKKTRNTQNLYDQDVLQTLTSSALIKSINGQQATLKSLFARQHDLNRTTEKTRHFVGLFNSSFSFSRHLLRAVVIGLGGWSILQGQLTIGALFVFVSYLESMNRPIGEISNFISRYGKAHASLERVEDYHRELLDNEERGGPTPVQTDWSQFHFRDVSFAYPEANAGLFSKLNLHFSRGEMVAMVGSSGSGKSSFIRLLNRLQDPDQGEILLDTQSLISSDLKSLRKHVCVIAQDPFFIAATVRENLVMALTPTPSDEMIFQSLQFVNADEFVSEFPQGLDTLIGESGLQISGGQAKRLSLARAFLRADQAKVFVFDEPTSGLDPLSAFLVMSSIKALTKKEKLVLYSTHRLEEFRLADSVLFFSPGQNPVLSSHTEHLETNQRYRSLVQADGLPT